MKLKIILIALIAIAVIPGCKRDDDKLLEPGVSIELAKHRKQNISNIHYNLFFNLPSDENEKITGTSNISFTIADNNSQLILDFRAPEENIIKVSANGQLINNYLFKNEHLVIPDTYLRPGDNTISVDFISTDQALNRNPDYLYTLLVPDRASTAFPCFDQPDLKARFSLKLEMPDYWKAISNGAKNEKHKNNSRKTVSFLPGKPISTYLFAFAAGDLKTYHHSDADFSMTVYHRETDKELFDNNINKIIDMHKESLQWMEGYTTIPYPYEKLDIILVPAFQYSGMEHPGAIYYRDSRLLLEEGASLSEQLGRASLIAHEVSHMWFGNLVTMNWFNDVWLKEVFASFMADKMVHPQYPEADHGLRFLTTHHRRAMAIDRSRGTHPIRQDLPNQKLAGTLYGPIIYNKAPIAFSQLEKLMSDKHFQNAVKEYLDVFSHGNANWDDLVKILNKHTEINIEKWSDAWIYGKGMPEISYKLYSKDNKIKDFKIKSTNPDPAGPFPSQLICYALLYDNNEVLYDEIFVEEHETLLKELCGKDIPNAVLLQAGGCGYAYFLPSEKTRQYLLTSLQHIDNDYLRIVGIMNLHEDFLNGNIKPVTYYESLLKSINKETHPQIIPVLLDNLKTVYWGFLNDDQRLSYSKISEALIWEHFTGNTSDQAQLYFKAFIEMGLTEYAIEKMRELLKDKYNIPGFKLSESDKVDIICELAVRDYENIAFLIDKQLESMQNPDRKRRFEFILPALSQDADVRDTFFEELKIKEKRRHEPWVIDALTYLHHPLRTDKSLSYIHESLAMIEEIQKTGDIFFPQRWLNATLNGYSSKEAKNIVENFLEENPGISENLRLKILQSADMLFRKAE